MAENSPAENVVGTVTANGATPLTYAITSGNNDPDGDSKAAFAIDDGTGKLTVNDAGDLDFETTSKFDLTVTATDLKGKSGNGAITVNLANIDEPGNEAPIAQNATFTLAENKANGTAVGTVTATDIDAGDTLVYSITDGNSDPDDNGKVAFAIDPATGKITVNDSDDINFENTPTFNLIVKATDEGGLSDSAAVKINLGNVNESPTAISLSVNHVNENVVSNTVIGSLGSTDPDAGNTFTYSLVSGDGATDNSAFTIAGNQLKIKVSPDFESQADYSIRVRTTDSGGLSFEKPLTINVNDLPEEVSFSGQATFPVGDGPRSVAMADFNGDGKTDLVTTNAWSDNLSVLLGDGSGSFGAQTTFALGDYPVSVATADFNGDGKIDLATTNHWSQNVSVLLGNGSGGFGPQTTFAVGDGPLSVATADFNGDGKTDLATANGWSLNVSVLLGNGSGGFGPQTTFAGSGRSWSLITADFNGDGKTDLATANHDDNNVSVRLGDGSGGFGPQTTFAVGDHPVSVVTADFNNDGKTDLATANHDIWSKNVSVLLGNGSGGFDAQTTFAVGKDPWSVTTADFNGDGKTDLATANTGTDNVSVLLGNGSGGFGAQTTFAIGNSDEYVATADFNGDGKSDLATVGSFGEDNVVVLLNTMPGTTVAPATFSVDENSLAGTAVGSVTATGATPLTYAISAGNSDPDGDGKAAFIIAPATGELTVNDAGDLDFETTPHFSLTVTATDPQGKSGNGAIAVNLANVDEPGNEAPDTQDASFMLAENSANATAVGTVAATDVDPGDSLTYSITAGNSDPNGNNKAAFTIDPAAGTITVNDSGDLDYEKTPVFNLAVKATDAGGLSNTATVKINLIDIFERVGTPGDDTLSGTTGNDVLSGLAGDDILSGSAGDDILIGGTGIDRVQEQGDVNFTLTDSQLTGLGTDTLSGIERAILSGGSGNNRIDASVFNRGRVILDGGAGNDTLIGPSMAGSFHLFDSSHNALYFNIFTGGDGDDTLSGGAGIDCIKETGNIDFTLTNGQLTGRGIDHFSSMEVAYLIGGPGNNRLDASGFNGSVTILEGGAGNDTLVGGVALDWARARGNADFTLTDTQMTGQGTDTLDKIDRAYLSGGVGDNRLDASAFTGDLVVLQVEGGNDTLIGRDGGIDRLLARGDVNFTLADNQLTGLGTDSLTSIEQAELIGGAGDNRLDVSAFTGNRIILEGGGGNDTFIGHASGIDQVRERGNVDFTLTDTQLTGRGTDSLVSIDQATLIGDGDGNTLDASAFTRGSVYLWGESGNDILKGGLGDDTLSGGVGDDTLIGGAGTDRVKERGDTDFMLSATQLTGLGTDTLDGIEKAYLCGGPRDNVLDASGFTGSLVVLEGQGGNDTLIGRAGGVDRVCAQGDVNFTLTDTQLTGLGTDTLTSIEQAQLAGNSGDNVFDASGFTRGQAILSGGSGNDSLLGGSGGDSLNGGYGDDILAGGLGADTFKFGSAAETGVTNADRDVIRDFDFSQGDRIDLSAIDADTTVEDDQAFASLTEGDTFSGVFANQGALYFDQPAHILYGNNDADSTADFSIQLTGVSRLSMTAFVL